MSKTFKLLLFVLQLLAGNISGDVSTGDIDPHSCGGVDIPYPFGIGAYPNSFSKGFKIVCEANKRPVLATSGDKTSIPIGNFSIRTAEARVMLPVGWQCYDASNNVTEGSYAELEFNKVGVYRISNNRNSLFVLGCSTVGLQSSKPGERKKENDATSYAEYTGCVCYCNNSESAMDGACSGVGCCHVDLPPDLVDNAVSFDSYSHKEKLSFSACDYAFLAEKDSYSFRVADLEMDLRRTQRMMPVRLDWAIRDKNTCEEARKTGAYACISPNSRCRNSTNGPGYVQNGCTDINECEHKYPCKGICKNKPGSYECTCPELKQC